MGKRDKLEWAAIARYLETLQIQASADFRRVNEIFELGKHLCPEELTGIFISNYVESGGKGQFKDLWLFSDNYVIEVLNFSRQETPKAEMTIFSSNIQYIAVEAKNCDLAKAVEDDAILNIKMFLMGDFQCDFTASGQNCNSLISIFEDYIKGNLTRGQTSSSM